MTYLGGPLAFYALEPEEQVALIAYHAIQCKPDDGPDFDEIQKRLAEKAYQRDRAKRKASGKLG